MEMEQVDERYLYRNRVLCRIIGVWPFETDINIYLMRTFCFAITVTGLSTQMLRVILFYSTDVIIEQCPFFLAGLGIAMKLINYSMNTEKLKGLVNAIYDDWKVTRTPAEIAIMDQYGKRGVLLTMIYIATGIFGTVVFISLPTVAGLIAYYSPNRNGTEHRVYIFPTHYPFDEDKYYIYFWMHMAIAITMTGIGYTACDTLYMYCVQHACGLLTVAGYRFKSAIENYANDEKESVKTMDTAYKKVCYSLQGHKRALSFIQDIHELHSTYLAAMVILVIAAFSITLVKTSITDVGFEFYKYLGFLVIQLIHLFFLTCQGQFVQNAYDDIYDDMYAGRWYNSSPKTQMLYLLALRGTLTAPALTAGGLLPLTLETFAEVLKASVSYFTVLKST